MVEGWGVSGPEPGADGSEGAGRYPSDPTEGTEALKGSGMRERRQAIQAHLERQASGWRLPLEGREVAGHTERLAEVMRETWGAGEPIRADGRIDWLRFAHGVEMRLAAPLAPVGAVDTGSPAGHRRISRIRCSCGVEAPLGASIERWWDEHLIEARPPG